jgi:hypothetical protein
VRLDEADCLFFEFHIIHHSTQLSIHDAVNIRSSYKLVKCRDPKRLFVVIECIVIVRRSYDERNRGSTVNEYMISYFDIPVYMS